MTDARLYERLYFRIRAKDLIDGINSRGRAILRYIEARWSRSPQDTEEAP
jgi:hypothetical protein